MKGRAATLLLLIFVLPLSAGLDIPRHVDPEGLREAPPIPSSLFYFYAGIISHLASEDWDRVAAELGRAAYIHVPPNLQFIISRFNELLEEGSRDLILAKLHIDNASTLVGRSMLDGARRELEEATFALARANRTVNGLKSSARQLGGMLGAPPTPLEREIAKLEALIDGYAARMRELLRNIEELRSKALVGTALTIQVEKAGARLGSRFSVWGFLTTVDGHPLASRAVEIYFDGVKVGEATTGGDGSYSFSFNLPYIYKERAPLRSSYTPRGPDFGRYLPSSSNVLYIELEYDKPSLTVEAPKDVYPGLDFAISGRLSLHDKPLSGFSIKVSALGQVAEAVTGADGSFSINVHVPPDAPTGEVALTVSASPRMAVGPASTTLKLNVVRLPAVVDVEAPSFALSGQSLTVKGRAIMPNGSPLAGAEIRIQVGEWPPLTTRSSSDGSFEYTISVPLTAFTARYEYTVSASPSQPWISPSSKVGSLLIVNAFSACIIPLLGITIALARRRGKPGGEPAPPVEEMRVAEGVEARALTGVQAWYWKAVAAVSKFTGVAMQPNLTIREYLGLVKGRLMEYYAPFERLSLLYERWLYSPIRTIEERLAERYFRELVEGLEG